MGYARWLACRFVCLTVIRIITRMDYVHLLNDINSISKCKIMFIPRKRVNSLSSPSLELNGTLLDSVSSYKCLGVTLTSDSPWSLHITDGSQLDSQ